MYKITEFNDENSVVLSCHLYLRSKYLYLGNLPFLTLTVIDCGKKYDNIFFRYNMTFLSENIGTFTDKILFHDFVVN